MQACCGQICNFSWYTQTLQRLAPIQGSEQGRDILLVNKDQISLFGEIESSDFEQTVPEFEVDHVLFGTFANLFEKIVADDSVAVVDESSLDVGLLQERPADL